MNRRRRLLDPRNQRRQQLVRQLHAAGPRPVLECLLEVAGGGDLDETLEAYGRLPPAVYRALGADKLPIDAGTMRGGWHQ